MLGPVAPILYVPEVILFEIVEFVAVSDVTERVPIVAVPVDAVMLEPNVTAPSWSGMVAVEIVAVLADRVPIVAVPVDAVTLEPNVTAPSCRGMVAVLIVAVEIVAVLADNVPMVAVPVEAVRLLPKVTGPRSRLLLETVNDPVLCTASIPIERADEVLSPSVITSTAPADGRPLVPKVFRSCG